MSETNKKGNAAIACADMKPADEKIIVEQGNYGASKNEIINLAGMEIKVEESVATNETKDGIPQIIDKKTGIVIGQLRTDGILDRKLKEIDKKKEDQEHDK